MAQNSSSILLHEPDPVLAGSLADTLILNGFAPKHLRYPHELVPLLASGFFRLVICDAAPDRMDMVHLVRNIRESSEYRTLQVMWLLERANRDLVMSLVQTGFSQFLAKPFTAVNFAERVRDWADKIQGTPGERRQHVRIEIPNYENAKLVFNTASGRKVLSKVKNISVGGLFIQWIGEQGFSRLSNGDQVTNALLLVGSLDLFVDVQVMAITESGVGLKFINLDERKLHCICSFLYDRIQQENLHARG